MRWRGHVVVVWWGPDGLGEDRVAVAGGRVLIWEDVGSCLATAAALGMSPKEVGLDVMELGPALAWLQRDGSDPDPVATLEMCTLASDITLSLDRAPDPEPLSDTVLAKLTAATFERMPYPADGPATWTRAELDHLSARLTRAADLLDEVFAPALRQPPRIELPDADLKLDPTA